MRNSESDQHESRKATPQKKERKTLEIEVIDLEQEPLEGSVVFTRCSSTSTSSS